MWICPIFILCSIGKAKQLIRLPNNFIAESASEVNIFFMKKYLLSQENQNFIIYIPLKIIYTAQYLNQSFHPERLFSSFYSICFLIQFSDKNKLMISFLNLAANLNIDKDVFRIEAIFP